MESWSKTMNFKWVSKVYELSFGGESKHYHVLQQMYVSNQGNTKWEDIPIDP